MMARVRYLFFIDFAFINLLIKLLRTKICVDVVFNPGSFSYFFKVLLVPKLYSNTP